MKYATMAAVLGGLAWLSGAVSSAAEPTATPAKPTPGHSVHGEAFNEGPRQQAYLLDGTGQVHLTVATANPQAQAFFDQGLGQLHGFWYFEAERSFRQVVLLDHNCAMAYWGLAMANVNNAERARKFIAEATKLKDKATKQEQLYIETLAAFHADAKQEEKRKHREFIRNWENLLDEYPEDIEAKAFLVWAIWSADGKLPISSHRAVDSLLTEIFKVNPLHPAHHYRIHLWDKTKAAKALQSAALGGPSAPAIAHMWHMPGHTYSNTQRIADAMWQQEAAIRVDHAYMARDQIQPYLIHNYAHNSEWLVRNCAQAGRVRHGLLIAKNLIEEPRHPDKNKLTKDASGADYGRTRLLELCQKFELWSELQTAIEQGYLDASGDEAALVRRLRAVGVAAIMTGDTTAAAARRSELTKLNEEILAAQTKAMDDAVAKVKEKHPDDKKKQDEARTAAERTFERRLEAVKRALAELDARTAAAAGDTQTAVAKFEAAGDLPKTLLSRAYLAAGNFDKAEQLARQAVEGAKDQVEPVANLISILAQAGKRLEAADEFARLRTLAADADLELPVFARLQSFAQELNLPTDWRVQPAAATDTGVRPAFETLGPLVWQPVAAPEWQLTKLDGSVTCHAAQRGKPVVMIFYLGAGCLHCVEQLQKFAPLAPQYEAAGIQLLGISSESPADVQRSLETFDKEKGFPIPLVSDETLSVFKKFRAFDEFENQPLHATVLVDGAGRIRWADISYKPFADPQFLLEEAQRLLKLPAPAGAVPVPPPAATGGQVAAREAAK